MMGGRPAPLPECSLNAAERRNQYFSLKNLRKTYSFVKENLWFYYCRERRAYKAYKAYEAHTADRAYRVCEAYKAYKACKACRASKAYKAYKV